MSTYQIANRLSFALMFLEIMLLVAITAATDWPTKIVSAAIALGLILIGLVYPRCRNCGKNPWFRKVAPDAWYAVVEYVPVGPLESVCSRCGEDLRKERQ